MIAALNPALLLPAGAPCSDPVFALIEEHRAAYAARAPLSEASAGLRPSDPAYAVTMEGQRRYGVRERAALATLTTSRPTTLLGVLALAEYLPDAIRRVATDEESDGEGALRSIAAALRGLVPPDATTFVRDPVLAAIAASRKAQAEMEAFLAETRGRLAMSPSDRARENALSGAQIDTDTAVWRTVPTTQAGRLALVDYARFQARLRTAPDGYIDNAEGLIEEILTAFSAALAAQPAVPAQDADEVQALALMDAIEHAGAQAGRQGA